MKIVLNAEEICVNTFGVWSLDQKRAKKKKNGRKTEKNRVRWVPSGSHRGLKFSCISSQPTGAICPATCAIRISLVFKSSNLQNSGLVLHQMLFPASVTGEFLEVVSSNVSVEQLEMDRERLDERRGFGSVKDAINFYKERIPNDNTPPKNSQRSYSEKSSSRIAELRQARKNTVQFSEIKRLADSVKSQAEAELTDAKKTVKELKKRIEESGSGVKAQIEDLEKLKKLRKDKVESGVAKDYQNTEVMRQLQNAKQELSKLKLDKACLLEEKTKAEEKREAFTMKAKCHSNSLEALMKEIENLNEEHVLVELARLEASKEREAIEAQRQEATKRYSAKLDESRRKINDISQEIERISELEKKLAITTSDSNLLESELKQVKEMDKRSQRNMKTDSSSALQLKQKELATSNKELESLKAESFELMASMDVIRNEINGIMEQTARLNRKEARTDLTIQNLNAKLLRSKAQLEAALAAEENAQSVISNLSTTLQKLKSDAEAAEKERVISQEKSAAMKAERRKSESEIDSAEERFQAALQQLQTAKSSEAKALEKLRLLTEKTMENRAVASQSSSKITISTFEYEYLKGCAVRAAEIADKKVAAAQAWVGALKASEKEILMKLEFSQRENKGIRGDGKQDDIKTGEPLSARSMVELELKNWWEKFGKVSGQENSEPQPKQPRRSGGIRFTPTGRARLRMLASPTARSTTRSASFTIKRQKVMPNLSKFLSGKGIDGDLKAM